MSRMGSHSKPDSNCLYNVALTQGGYFSLLQAKEAGYSSPLVEYHVQVGHFIRVARGIFRLFQFPNTENEDLIIDWLWSKQVAIFSHETALMLHQLSDALPSKRHMTFPLEWKHRRIRIPKHIIPYFKDIQQSDRSWVGEVPVTTPLRTIVDCIVIKAEPILIQQAKRQAIRRGLFERGELTNMLNQVKDHSYG